MPDVPLNFDWEVAKAGHRWLQTHAMDQGTDVRWHYLTPAHSTGSARFLGLRYHPLAAYSGLFRNFAATEPDADAIKAFADRFGMLGGNLRKRIVLHDEAGAASTPWASASISATGSTRSSSCVLRSICGRRPDAAMPTTWGA